MRWAGIDNSFSQYKSIRTWIDSVHFGHSGSVETEKQYLSAQVFCDFLFLRLFREKKRFLSVLENKKNRGDGGERERTAYFGSQLTTISNFNIYLEIITLHEKNIENLFILKTRVENKFFYEISHLYVAFQM